MRHWDIRAIVLSLAVVILLVEGFFVYRFYTSGNAGNIHSEKGISATRSSTSEITMPESTSLSTMPESTSSELTGPTTVEKTTEKKTAPKSAAPSGATFIHRSTEANTSANSTFWTTL